MGAYKQFLAVQQPRRAARDRLTRQTISVAVANETGARQIHKHDVLPYVICDEDGPTIHVPPRQPLEDPTSVPVSECEDHSVLYDDGPFLSADTIYDDPNALDVSASGQKKNTEQVS
jgi:hypothetical protein